jgi:hypothetical protein
MKVRVYKVDLAEGEELMQLVDKVMSALAQQRAKLKRSLSLRGIFKDFIVVMDVEKRKMYKLSLARSDKGELTIGKEFEEVVQTFVPAKKVEKGEEQPATLVAVGDDVREIPFDADTIHKMMDALCADEVEIDIKEGSLWDGVL